VSVASSLAQGSAQPLSWPKRMPIGSIQRLDRGVCGYHGRFSLSHRALSPARCAETRIEQCPKTYLVLDNASYNKAIRVREQAEASRIILKFQPPYSPNLNLIERLWKFMRKKFCKDKYRSTFAKFKTQLDGFFAGLDEYRNELVTLLTEKFELVPSVWRAPDMA